VFVESNPLSNRPKSPFACKGLSKTMTHPKPAREICHPIDFTSDDIAQLPATATLPPRSSKRLSTGHMSTDDAVLARAWSQAAGAVTEYYVGLLEDGGECILLTTDMGRPKEDESSARWLIWCDAGWVLTKLAGTRSSPAKHASMQDALQSIAALSETEMRSVVSYAEAILMSVDQETFE